MPVAVSNLTAQILSTPAAGTPADSGVGPTAPTAAGLFRSALATALGQPTPAAATDQTQPAATARTTTTGRTTATGTAADETDDTTDTTADEIAAASATGIPLIDPTLIPGTLLAAAIGPSPSVEAAALANAVTGGVPVAQAAAQTAIPANAAEAETRSRAEQLSDSRAGSRPPTVTTTNQPPVPATTTAAQPAPPTPAAGALPQPTAPAVQGQVPAITTPAATAVRLAQTNVVPAQAPVVTNLSPPAATPPVPADAVPVVAATPATRPAPAITETIASDRPATAGQRFEAIAEAGARLVQGETPAPVAFANVLDQTAPAVRVPSANVPAVPPATAAATAPADSGAVRVGVLPASADVTGPRPTVVVTENAPRGATPSATPPVTPPASAPASAAVRTDTAPAVTAPAPAPAPLPVEVTATRPVPAVTLESGVRPVRVDGAAGSAAFPVVVPPRQTPDLIDLGDEPRPEVSAFGSPGGIVASPAHAPTAAPQQSTPPAPASAPPPAPAVQLAEAVVKHAHITEHEGSVEFRMRLDPPDLGPVRVRLVSAGDEIHGHLVVADDAVRRMVESQLPELRQRLQDAGVSVQRFDVATDPGGWAGGNRNPYREFPPAPVSDGTPRPGAPAPAANGRRGVGTGLDVVV